jgi:putative NADH-flavin reductase
VKLIVFGPSGGTGRELIAQGLAAGHEVTAFSRRELDTPATLVVGNVLDRAAVESAVRGHDVVLSALGTRPWRHVDICSGGVAAMIPAMQAAGVRRIIAMSSLGVGEPKAGLVVRVGGAILLRKAFRDKAAMEQLLADSDLDWIAVRPGFLTSGKARGTSRVADDGSLKGGRISRADTASFMLQQLASPEWLRKRPVIVW